MSPIDYRFTRRQLLATLTAGTVGVAGCLSTDQEPREFSLRDEFSDGLDEWDSEAHIGPNADLEAFEWSVELTDEMASAGDQSISIFTEGKYDDGTAWIARPIEIEADRRYDAEVSFQAWSPSESFNTRRRVVPYLGQGRPTAEDDFPQTGWNSTDKGTTLYGGLREALDQTDGWHEYTFEWQSSTVYTDTLWFADGVTVVWESDLRYAIDDIDVHIETR